MKPRHLFFVALIAVALMPSLKAAAVSDLNSTEKRRAVITVAQQLTRPPEPAPLPADLAQPFNPPGFDQPDPEELRAAAAAAAKAAGQSAVAPGAGAAGGGEPGPQPGGDREILDGLAARLVPSGTIMLNGAPLLIIGKNRFEIGAHFIVSDNTHNQDYELELVSIDRTTFTLRYHSAEVTRPIKPGKSQ